MKNIKVMLFISMVLVIFFIYQMFFSPIDRFTIICAYFTNTAFMIAVFLYWYDQYKFEKERMIIMKQFESLTETEKEERLSEFLKLVKVASRTMKEIKKFNSKESK